MKPSLSQLQSQNTQLPFPISPSTQASPISSPYILTSQPNHCIASSQINLVLSKVSYIKYSADHKHLGASSKWHTVILRPFTPRLPNSWRRRRGERGNFAGGDDTLQSALSPNYCCQIQVKYIFYLEIVFGTKSCQELKRHWCSI